MAGSRGKHEKPQRSEKTTASSGDAVVFLRASAEWKGYVNVEFGKDESSRFASFTYDADLVQEITAAVLFRGYKLSVVQSDDAETYKATAYAAFKYMPDEGIAVSAWAGSPLEALAAVVYIVGVYAAFDLSSHFEAVARKGRRTF